ncbi:MAG: hypothetical protein IPK22_03390 [Verrucomicrobiaceae bacterium]|nr:hypothetical protein [Verrucomicrobiaceae bacterium]
MNLLAHAQEQARRFNEDEAVQHELERLQFLRRLFGSGLPRQKEILDDLDWQNAVRSRRQTRAISLPLP